MLNTTDSRNIQVSNNLRTAYDLPESPRMFHTEPRTHLAWGRGKIAWRCEAVVGWREQRLTGPDHREMISGNMWMGAKGVALLVFGGGGVVCKPVLAGCACVCACVRAFRQKEGGRGGQESNFTSVTRRENRSGHRKLVHLYIQEHSPLLTAPTTAHVEQFESQ